MLQHCEPLDTLDTCHMKNACDANTTPDRGGEKLLGRVLRSELALASGNAHGTEDAVQPPEAPPRAQRTFRMMAMIIRPATTCVGLGSSAIVLAMLVISVLSLPMAGSPTHASLSADTHSSVTVYVFPHQFCHLLHAGALMRMCTLAGVERCEIVDVDPLLQQTLAFSLIHHNATFGMPIVVDGDLRLSQNVAATAYVGEKFGFAANVPAMKGVQLMLDMRDFVDELKIPVTIHDGVPYPQRYQLNGTGALQHLEHLVQRGRYHAWLSYLDAAMVGPYSFGDAPTYTDL